MANEMTVNRLLCMQRAIRSRLNELQQTQSSLQMKTRYFRGLAEDRVLDREEEPMFDVKDVAKKISLMRNWLFEIDAAIKESNAKTFVWLPEDLADFKDLMAPME